MPLCNIFLFTINSFQYVFKDAKTVAQVVCDFDIFILRIYAVSVITLSDQ